MPPLKIVSYNINGIRASMKKGLATWLAEENIDIVCLQEIKANQDQIEKEEKELKALGYECYWFSAEKKGYSGTAILTKVKPDHIEYGCGNKLYDSEGRVMRMDYKGLSIISAYFPSGSSGDARQAVKMEFLDFMLAYLKNLKDEHPELIVAGDYNIAHTEIDIHNPKANQKTSGFLPEEREWMDTFFEAGYIDTFRAFNTQADHYSWWSYRAASRQRNKGWRIDYIAISKNLKDKLLNAAILNEAVHSDHCPVMIELKA